MPTCYRCKKNNVSEEFTRCVPCEQSHKELCAQLDAQPRTKEKKVKEKLYPIQEIKQGIKITTWISAEDAHNMGIKLPI